MSVINLGDVLATIILLGMSLLPIIIVVLLIKTYKKNVKRAEQRIEIEKQKTMNIQKQVDELNQRISKIENLLKEVE